MNTYIIPLQLRVVVLKKYLFVRVWMRVDVCFVCLGLTDHYYYWQYFRFMVVAVIIAISISDRSRGKLLGNVIISRAIKPYQYQVLILIMAFIVVIDAFFFFYNSCAIAAVIVQL